MTAALGVIAFVSVMAFLFAIAALIADRTEPEPEPEPRAVEWPRIHGSNCSITDFPTTRDVS